MNETEIMFESHYQFLGHFVTVTSDSKELLTKLDNLYGWFRVPSADHGKKLILSLILGNGRVPRFEVIRPKARRMQNALSKDLQFQSGSNYRDPVSWGLQKIIGTILLETKEHLVLHAGVVAYDGFALILAGPPGTGKTTLVLELLKKNFRFMSDDLCPINRKTHLVHPFPKRPWVVQSGSEKDPSQRARKKLLVSDQLKMKLVSRFARPFGWIMCLDEPDWYSREHEIRISLQKDLEKPLLSHLASLSGVQVEMVGHNSCEMRVRYPKRVGLTKTIRKLLNQNQTAITDAFKWERVCPDFSSKPVLRSIRTHEATFRLLRHLKGSDFFLPDLVGASLFWECAAILADVPCWSLKVGELEETVNLIVATVKYHTEVGV